MKGHLYKRILSRLKIGNIELPNRIVFGAHPTNFASRNLLSDRHVAYYRERARGGAGMIVLEEQLVHPSDLPYEKALFGFSEEIIPGYRRVAEAVHEHGAVVVAQLNHSGMQSEGSTAMHVLWAPGTVPDVVSREVPKAMEESDIAEVTGGFARAAGHAVAGGLDGVEINAAQFSLVRQFMSPLTNRRADSYGGSLANRLRFCIEILKAVRAVLGEDRLLGIRLCGDELAPWGGLTPEDAAEIAVELEKLDVLDYLTVSAGSLYSLHLSAATFYIEPGFAVEAAAKIKKAVRLPVFAEGRIHRPEYAARIVDEGLVDGVYMNRALICDPWLPRKLERGEVERVRECLSCNQGCQVRHAMGKPLSCAVNPVAGREYEEETAGLRPAGAPKKVLVVGGGPAGMEAARTAAIRGHRVILWEAGPAPGGALAACAHIGEFARLLKTWARELADCGVAVVTGKYCRPEDVLAERPDALVLATGSRTAKPAFPVRKCPAVTAREAAVKPDGVGKTVLFWDEVGDRVMARAVEKLLAGGKTVYFVTPDLFAGGKLAATLELTPFYRRFMAGAAEIFTSSLVIEVDGGRAVVENRFGGRTVTLTGIDTLVYNCWPRPDESLYLALKDRVEEVYRAGDCLAPRGIAEAVRDGYLIGKSL
ncbi:NADH:flavin oxidoreductases [Pelotomaculum thermopropionicum SI]|uniref:NADH:flavin oxidoreductases n=1 Tax=Pelotomaculum thermopropionicum (strain DSM 13744 / JCM 10971 / SI) TaxID=370438 RepID=A5D4R7_PELTS|nr:NADH:flavin oxidoreductases [Pelotomaculum thermopropionicum SI]